MQVSVADVLSVTGPELGFRITMNGTFGFAALYSRLGLATWMRKVEDHARLLTKLRPASRRVWVEVEREEDRCCPSTCW